MIDERPSQHFVISEDRVSSFNPYDWNLFYFAQLTRDETEAVLLEPEIPYGTFLIRDSTTSIGDYVLCVLLVAFSVLCRLLMFICSILRYNV